MAKIPLRKVTLSERWAGNIAGKQIAKTALYPVVETEDVAEQVALHTGYPKQAAVNIINSFMESASVFLKQGHPVRLGALGIIKVTVKSKPVDPDGDEQLSPSLLPAFRAGTAMKRAVAALPYTFIGNTEDDEDVDDGDIEDDGDNENDNPGGNPGDDDLTQ